MECITAKRTELNGSTMKEDSFLELWGEMVIRNDNVTKMEASYPPQLYEILALNALRAVLFT